MAPYSIPMTLSFQVLSNLHYIVAGYSGGTPRFLLTAFDIKLFLSLDITEIIILKPWGPYQKQIPIFKPVS